MDQEKRKLVANIFILPSIAFIVVLIAFMFIQEDASASTKGTEQTTAINTNIPKGKEKLAKGISEADYMVSQNHEKDFNSLSDYETILNNKKENQQHEQQHNTDFSQNEKQQLEELKNVSRHNRYEKETKILNARQEKLKNAILVADQEQDDKYSEAERYADSILEANSHPVNTIDKTKKNNKKEIEERVIGEQQVVQTPKKSRFSSSSLKKNDRCQAAIYRDQTVKNGNTVTLLLKEGVTLDNGVYVDAGNFVTAVVSFSTNRIRLTTKTIRVKSKIYPFNRSIYSLDGLEGIAVPDNIKEEYSKAMKDLATDNAAEIATDEIESSTGGGIVGGAVKGVVSITKSLAKKKNNQIEVLMRDGYELILE